MSNRTRRRFLGLAGASLTTAIAGCSSTSDSGDGGPAGGDGQSGGTPSPSEPTQTATETAPEYETAVGEPVEVEDGLWLTVEDVTFQEMLFVHLDFQDYPGQVAMADDGNIFALYSVSVKNEGSRANSFDGDVLTVPNGELDSPLTNAVIYDVGPLFNNPPMVDEGETEEGVVLAQLPKEAAATSAPLALQLDSDTDAPEHQWSFAADSPRSFPELELRSIDPPETAQAGQSFEIDVTVANTGEAAGVMKLLLEYLASGAGGWEPLTTAEPSPLIEEEVPAGEEMTISVSNTAEDDGDFHYRVRPYTEQTFEITIE